MNLQIVNLDKKFKDRQVLEKINFSLESGHFYGLLGNNGAGKTTLTKCIFNEYKFTGKILIDGEVLKGSLLHQMFYFSDNTDLPRGLSMLSFLRNQYLLHCGNLKNFQQALEQENTFFSKSNLKKTLVKSLSSGEQKLLSLLACKIINPKIIFFDEPTANLDISNKEILLEEIKKIGNQNKIIVIITHLVEEVKNLVDKVIILDKSKVVFDGHLSGEEIKRKFLEKVSRGN